MSLKAAKGNGGTATKLDKLRKQGTALALDLDDLAEAIVAADADVLAAEEELGQSERKRHWAGIHRVKDEIVARAKVADIELIKAGTSIAKLRQGLQFHANPSGMRKAFPWRWYLPPIHRLHVNGITTSLSRDRR